MSGKLVGINTAIFSRGGGSIGIGFAIPANMVRVVVASARGGANVVKRPWLGARLQAVTSEIAESIGLKRPAGALVTQVTQGSPAARGGLRTGDLIVALDDQPIEDSNAFDYRFATKMIGGTSRIRLQRSGRDTTVTVALEVAPELPRDELVIESRSPFQGLKVSNISPSLADQLRLDAGAEGVVVVEVANGSIGQRFFQAGDVLVTVNNQKMTQTSDLDKLARQQTRLWRIVIRRGGQQMSVELRG
jgi:S1-C subfamily serine protease